MTDLYDIALTQQASTWKTTTRPFQCPVCFGVGKVANGFYNRASTQTWSSNSTAPEPCRSCAGTGIVWS